MSNDDGIFFRSFEAMIENLCAIRYAWRDPNPEEAKPDSAGSVVLALRDNTYRTRCLGHAYEARHRLVFLVAVEEIRDSEEGNWLEFSRFPLAYQVRRDDAGNWRYLNLMIAPSANEWRFLAPDNLRQLLDTAPP